MVGRWKFLSTWSLFRGHIHSIQNPRLSPKFSHHFRFLTMPSCLLVWTFQQRQGQQWLVTLNTWHHRSGNATGGRSGSPVETCKTLVNHGIFTIYQLVVARFLPSIWWKDDKCPGNNTWVWVEFKGFFSNNFNLIFPCFPCIVSQGLLTVPKKIEDQEVEMGEDIFWMMRDPQKKLVPPKERDPTFCLEKPFWSTQNGRFWNHKNEFFLVGLIRSRKKTVLKVEREGTPKVYIRCTTYWWCWETSWFP